MKRKANVVWRGDGENGSGEFSTGSGLFRVRFTNVTAGAEAIHIYRIA